jgi:dolichol-phosphate mannosyltransferase
MSESIYIVMPAYNESENIGFVVDQWHKVVEKIGNNSRLLIVDDSSKDHTFKILLELTKQYPFLEVVTKPNTGHGVTCLFAYQYAILRNPEWIFQTDSDGQTNPIDFWQFWEKRQQYDFLIGLRNKRLDGVNRIFVTRVLKIILFLIFQVNVPDANTPFRLIRSKTLVKYLEIIPSDSFLSNVIMSTLIVKDKLPFLWLPIQFKPRQGGENSIDFKKIVKIGLKAINDFYKIKKKYMNIKK